MPNPIRAWRKRRRCPHVHMNGIYGDAINLLNARLMCMDCGALLEGPVVLAEWRMDEARKLADWRRAHGISVPEGTPHE